MILETLEKEIEILKSRVWQLEQRRIRQGLLTTLLPGDHMASGLIAPFIASAAVVFGEICYINTSAQMVKTDADAAATSFHVGLALGSIAASAEGEFLLLGMVRNDAWNWTVGGILYLDTATAGGMTQTAPSGVDDVIIVVGVALSADRILFRPSGVIVEHV